MKTAPDIPSFGYAASDFKTYPFVFEMSRLGPHSIAPRGFPHRHTYFHVLWLTRGEGVHVVDFDEYALRPPSVFFIAPRQVHCWNSEPPVDGYSIKFTADLFERLVARGEGLQGLPFAPTCDPPVMYLDGENAAAMEPLLAQLLKESQSDAPWRNEMVAALLHVALLRLRRLQPPPPPAPGARQVDAVVRRFMQLLDTHLLTLGRASDYAQLLEMPTATLNDALKHVTGRTASQLMSERLLLEAKRRLMFSGVPIADIAAELGFEDPAYFARFFRKGAQVSPGEFRRACEGFR